MNIDLLCYLAAFVFFMLHAFGVPSRVNWEALGFAALTLSLIL